MLHDSGAAAAGLRLLWQDEEVWGQQPPVAAYVHGLVVSEQHRGDGLGSALLRWAAAQARVRERTRLRLDCGEVNDALRRYYTHQGFQVVGRRVFTGPWHPVILLEQQL